MESSTGLMEGSHTDPQNLYDRFLEVMSKPIQQRTNKQISQIFEFVSVNKALHELSQKLSFKFVKNLLSRHANLLCVGPNTIIAGEGNKINHVYFIIEGRAVKVIKNNRKFDKNLGGKEDYSIYEKLGIMAHKEMKEINKLKHRKPTRKLSKQFDEDYLGFRRNTKHYEQSQLEQTNLIGLQDRTQGQKYLQDVFMTEKGVVLEIPVSGFLTCLAIYLDSKIKKLHDQIVHYPCFHGLDSQIVESIIVSLSEKRHQRGTYIYRQNQHIHSIYFLASGEIRLTKQSNLFVENPNTLYANRISLMIEQQQNSQKTKARYKIKQEQTKKAQASLPYADLSLMFNYVPKKKVIQISKLHSFSIFGAEELIESKKRQTNAICNSLEVIYYEISIVKLQEILGVKNMQKFINGLKNQAKNKVLHRQSNFANTINLLNQKNLDYFYFEGDQEQKSHHKIKILKLNNKLQQKGTRLKEKHQSLDERIKVQPHFTAFNFHKLNTLAPIQNTNFSTGKMNTLTTDSPNPETAEKKTQSDDEIEQIEEPTKQQMKIMNITHTWKLIKKKVDVEMIKSQKISPKKFTIDVNEPLISNNFFTELDKEKRRVERQIRKDKITLGRNRETFNSRKIAINF